MIVIGIGPAVASDTDGRPADIHAADVSAERLPSLHGTQAESLDPNATEKGVADNAAPPPDNSTQLVPKPRPALHPDHYTPGTAPPATDLTPGSPKPPPDLL